MTEHEMPAQNQPLVTSRQDVVMVRTFANGKYNHHSFWYITPDDEVWHGVLSKSSESDHPTVEELNQHLKHIEDSKVWPENPATITIASDLKDVYIKRPGFDFLDTKELGPSHAASEMLHEAITMELVTPHPNIVTYHGCRVHRGRITGIVLEKLKQNLRDPADISDIPDIPAFLADLQSAVDHIHSFGMAHNDIKPENIMVKNGRPILIDFGSCYPFGPGGTEYRSGGSLGWYDESITGSAKEHDAYAMAKLREWLEDAEKEKGKAANECPL